MCIDLCGLVQKLVELVGHPLLPVSLLQSLEILLDLAALLVEKCLLTSKHVQLQSVCLVGMIFYVLPFPALEHFAQNEHGLGSLQSPELLPELFAVTKFVPCRRREVHFSFLPIFPGAKLGQ